jgi:hypothetical protein
MKDSLTKRGLLKKYTFDYPVPLRVPKVLKTFTGIKAAFSDPSKFKTVYEKYGYGSILMFDDVEQWVHLCRRSAYVTDSRLDTIQIKQWFNHGYSLCNPMLTEDP